MNPGAMERKLEQLQIFLDSYDLGEYYDAITNQLKIKSVAMLKFASEDDLLEIGMSRPQIKMLFDCYKKEQSAFGKLKRIFVVGRAKSKPNAPFSGSLAGTESSIAGASSSGSSVAPSNSSATPGQGAVASNQSISNDYVMPGVAAGPPVATVSPTMAEGASAAKVVDEECADASGRSGAHACASDSPVARGRRGSARQLERAATRSALPDKPTRGTQTHADADAEGDADVRAAAGCRLIPASEIQLCRSVGAGEFATVYEARWHARDGQLLPVAVKVLLRERLQSNECEFLREAQLARRIAHAHIVRLFGVVFDGESMMLVTELAAHKSLLECLRDPLLSRQFALPTLARFTTQLADAMCYLEQRRLVHRDLAARNVLVFALDTVKVSDFGMSRALALGSDYYRTQFSADLKLPIAWCAPECINYLKFTSASDVWAFGVTVWEMFSYGEQPWRGLDAAEILIAIDEPRCERLGRPTLCPTDFYSLLRDCWQHRPEARVTFDRVHSLLTRGDCRIAQLQALTESDADEAHSSNSSVLQYARGDTVYVIDRSPTDAPVRGFWFGVLATNPKAAGYFEPRHFVPDTTQHAGNSSPSSSGAHNVPPFERRSLRHSTVRRLQPSMPRQSSFGSTTTNVTSSGEQLVGRYGESEARSARNQPAGTDATRDRGQINHAAAFSTSSTDSINAIVNGDDGDRNALDLNLNLLDQVLEALTNDGQSRTETNAHAAPARLRCDGEEDEDSRWQFTQTWPIIAPPPTTSRAETAKRNKFKLKLDLEPNVSDASYPAALHEPLLVSTSTSDGSTMRALSSSAEKKLDNAIALAEECAAKSNASLNERHATPLGSAGSVREQPAPSIIAAISGSPNSSSVVTVSTVKSSDSDRDERERESGGSSPTRKKPPFRIAFHRRTSTSPRGSTSPKAVPPGATVNRVLFSFTDEMEARMQRALALSPTDVDAYNALVDKAAAVQPAAPSRDDVEVHKVVTTARTANTHSFAIGQPSTSSPKVMGRAQSNTHATQTTSIKPITPNPNSAHKLLRESGPLVGSMRVPPRRSSCIAMPSGALLPSRNALPNADSASSSSGVSSTVNTNANASANASANVNVNVNINPLPVPPRMRSDTAATQSQSGYPAAFDPPAERHTLARTGLASSVSPDEQSSQSQSSAPFQRDPLRATVINSRASPNDTRRNSMPLEPPPAPPSTHRGQPPVSTGFMSSAACSNTVDQRVGTEAELSSQITTDMGDRFGSSPTHGQTTLTRAVHTRVLRNGVGDAVSSQRTHANSPKHDVVSNLRGVPGATWTLSDDIQLDPLEASFYGNGISYDDRTCSNTRNRTSNGSSSPRTQRQRSVRR